MQFMVQRSTKDGQMGGSQGHLATAAHASTGTSNMEGSSQRERQAPTSPAWGKTV